MGATYTRQSSSAIVDGAVIEASDINAEFDQILAAFAVSSGHTHDGTAAEGGPITKLLGTAITIGDGTTGTDIAVTFDGETGDGVLTWMEDEDYFQFSDDLLLTTTEKLQFRDTAIYINSSADGQLDLVADTEIQIAATTVDINGNVDVSGTLTVGGALDFSDANITNIGSIALDTITNDGTDITLDSSGDIILDAGGANVTIKDDGTSILDIANSSSDVELTVSVADKNFKIKGTDGSSAITALDIDMALAGKATFNGDVVVTGDLTVTGDDITMGTNTSGNLLVADGTNFNSVAVGSLSEISTVAGDDVLLAVDTSGGGLKKITRSTLTAGIVSGSEISNIVEDTSPQLGGDLDTNSFNIAFDDAHGINDENGNEQIIFQTTSSAVNQFDITNAATGNAPSIKATGGDTNIDFNISAKGTGHITVLGDTNAGAIQFNCESNSHGQILKSQPHSAGVTNEMLLPAGSSSTLVSLVSTDTLENKTLTTPTIAEIDSGSTITLDATTDIVLDAGGADVIFKDDGTSILTLTNNSTDVDFTVATQDKDINFKGDDGGSGITALSLDMSDAGTAVFNHDIRIADDGQIGSASDADAMTISASGVVTFSQAPVFPDGVVPLVDLDIDGGTDIGADLTTSDLIIVDDGAGGTNRKAALSRLTTFMTGQGFSTDDPTALAIALG